MMRWWEGERRKKSKKNIRNISNMAQRALERILIVFKYLLPELFKFHSCPSESPTSLNTRELKISSVNNTFTSSIGAVWVRPKERWRWKMQSPVLDSRKRFKLTFLLSKISSDDATRASVSRSCKREKISFRAFSSSWNGERIYDSWPWLDLMYLCENRDFISHGIWSADGYGKWNLRRLMRNNFH